MVFFSTRRSKIISVLSNFIYSGWYFVKTGRTRVVFQVRFFDLLTKGGTCFEKQDFDGIRYKKMRKVIGFQIMEQEVTLAVEFTIFLKKELDLLYSFRSFLFWIQPVCGHIWPCFSSQSIQKIQKLMKSTFNLSDFFKSPLLNQNLELLTLYFPVLVQCSTTLKKLHCTYNFPYCNCRKIL